MRDVGASAGTDETRQQRISVNNPYMRGRELDEVGTSKVFPEDAFADCSEQKFIRAKIETKESKDAPAPSVSAVALVSYLAFQCEIERRGKKTEAYNNGSKVGVYGSRLWRVLLRHLAEFCAHI